MAAPVAVPQLAPASKQIGIFPNFIARQSEGLLIREKVMSLSGDSFDIKTASGQTVFKITGSAFSLSGRKELRDAQGNHLFTIRKKLLALHATFFFEDPAGKQIFETRSHFTLGGAKFTAHFVDNTGVTHELGMKGSFWDTSAEIKDNTTGLVVARIDRKFGNAGELLFGQQTYMVTVAPGMDMSIIVGMCVCLDEKKNEK